MKPKGLFRIHDGNQRHGRLVVVRIEKSVGFVFIIDDDFRFRRPIDSSQLLLCDIRNQIAFGIDLNDRALNFACHRCWPSLYVSKSCS